MAARGIVLFRAETGSATGLGHLMRSRAVALAVRELGGDARFVVDDSVSAARLAAEGFAAVLADERPGWCAEDARGVWLDGRRDLGPELAACASLGLACFLVESRSPARARAAAVVQPALHHRPDAWEERHAERVLAGAAWIPLAPEILAAPRASAPDLELLVTFGGSDPRHLTERALAALAGCGRRIAVLVGPHMEARRHALERLVRRASSSAEVLPSAGSEAAREGIDVPRLLRRARLALTAVGTTLYELAFLQVPAAILANFPEDRPALDHYAHCGPHLSLGLADEVGEAELRRRLLGLLAAPPGPTPPIPGLGQGARALARCLLAGRVLAEDRCSG